MTNRQHVDNRANQGPDELMIDGQKLLIDACVAEKVERYMASDYTLDYLKLQMGELPSKDPMMHVMRYLEGRPIKGIHVMIGAFIEVFWHYLGMWDAKSYELKYWGSGDEKWDFTTYDNTAQWMAAVALDPGAEGVLKCECLACLVPPPPRPPLPFALLIFRGGRQ